MIPLLAIIFGIALVPAVGGTYGRLRQAEVRAAVLIPLALLLQTLSTSDGPLWGAPNATLLPMALWVVGALCLVAVCWRNRRLYGMQLIAVGVCMNALVIVANLGMPVGVAALAELDAGSAGQEAVAQSMLYRIQEETTRFLVLADVLPVPGPRLMRAIVSLGDLLLFAGVVITIVESSSRLHAAKGT